MDNSRVIEGKCGDNVFYSLTPDGLLRVYGKGRVDCIVTADENYEIDEYSVWRDAEYEVKEVVIEEGITSLDMAAFAHLESLEKVQLPESLQIIGEFCFAGCTNLVQMNRPKNLYIIKFDAFYNTKLEKKFVKKKPKKKLRRQGE